MTANNPNLDLMGINAYIKFGEYLSLCSQDKRKSGPNEDHNSVTNLRNMTGNNLNQVLVNVDNYIKFGEILSFCYQDIEQKRTSNKNQGP